MKFLRNPERKCLKNPINKNGAPFRAPFSIFDILLSISLSYDSK